jgi:predicted transcriptional regulator
MVREDVMSTAKAEVARMLEELPDDVSYEDIQYHIYVRQKVAKGLKDAKDGRLVSHDDAERRLARWQD